MTSDLDERAIRKVLRDFLKPLEVGDVEALLDFYTDDAVWMVPSSLSDSGCDEARAFYKAAFARGDFAENSVEVHELQLLGDWAFVRCTAKGKFIASGVEDGPVRTSRHVYLFRREPDRKWRIARDICNHPDK